MSESMAILKEMVETPGIAGRESQICQLIKNCATDTNAFDDIAVDALGNLICHRAAFKKNHNTKRILVVAHMDQCGFLVSFIAEDGALYLHPVGTWDARTLGSQPVWVVSRHGDRVAGHVKIAGKPVHTAAESELNRSLSIEDFYVDIAQSGEWAKEHVAPGDMVVFRGALERIGGALVGAGLDDRLGCWAMIQSLPLLTNTHDEFFFAFSVQEELGSRGVGPVCGRLEPDIAIVCETVVSCDTPGVAMPERVTEPGKGIALQLADSSMISDESLVKKAEQALTNAHVPHQLSIMRGGGQDGAIIQRSGRGVKTLALGCPLKYMHSAHEYVNTSDMEAYPVTVATLLNAL